jgi:hypothetical protein
MTRARIAALALLSGALIAGTIADERTLAAYRAGTAILAGDFHVHAFPGDGLLPRWELKREAARRGLDVIAITNHNQTLAADLTTPIGRADILVLRGQEITNPRYHMIAAGIRTTIDWRLPAADAAAAVHAQGGVAIAAHPLENSWQPGDAATLAALDGVEAAHPLVYFTRDGRDRLAAFWRAVRAVNPDIAVIGSSDLHRRPGMGDCRTFLLVTERSEQAVLDAIRTGRTVASDRVGSYIGDPELVGAVQRDLAVRPHLRPPYRFHLCAAAAVLVALAMLVIFQ